MRKFFLALTVTALVVIGSSMAFAYSEEEARDALITYSGTAAFSDLLPEERRACMTWVSEGGYMNELCRSAVTRLISEDPNAVTPSQRKALLAAASGRTTPAPTNSGETVVVRESDNTGSMIAAGIVGIIAGMIIHNNLPGDRDTVYYPVPYHHHRPPHYHIPGPPPHHRIPGPPHHRAPVPPHRAPAPIMRRNPGPIRTNPPRVPHRAPSPVRRVPNTTMRDIPRR